MCESKHRGTDATENFQKIKRLLNVLSKHLGVLTLSKAQLNNDAKRSYLQAIYWLMLAITTAQIVLFSFANFSHQNAYNRIFDSRFHQIWKILPPLYNWRIFFLTMIVAPQLNYQFSLRVFSSYTSVLRCYKRRQPMTGMKLPELNQSRLSWDCMQSLWLERLHCLFFIFFVFKIEIN